MAKKSARNSAPSVLPPAVEDRPEVLLSSREVCDRLNISAKTLQRLCQRKQINYVRMSDTLYRFRPGAVELFLAKREVKAAA
jgi:excisionase family DNA binding protein